MESLPPVLIVDDEADDVFILKRLLHKAGIENKLISFEDPTAALAYLEGEILSPRDTYIPWLVFTDLHMPSVTGIHLTSWIRAQPSLHSVIVIMTTSSEDPKDKAAAHRAGVDRYLLKYPTVKMLAEIAAEFKPRMKTSSA